MLSFRYFRIALVLIFQSLFRYADWGKPSGFLDPSMKHITFSYLCLSSTWCLGSYCDLFVRGSLDFYTHVVYACELSARGQDAKSFPGLQTPDSIGLARPQQEDRPPMSRHGHPASQARQRAFRAMFSKTEAKDVRKLQEALGEGLLHLRRLPTTRAATDEAVETGPSCR